MKDQKQLILKNHSSWYQMMAFHVFFLNQSSKMDAEAMGEWNKALLGVVMALKVHDEYELERFGQLYEERWREWSL